MRNMRSPLNIFEATLPSNTTRPAEFNIVVMRINAIGINDRNIQESYGTTRAFAPLAPHNSDL
jgi:hypothetical protein